MPATLDEVRDIIKKGFDGSSVTDVKEENHRITGIIVWKDFKKMSLEERNRLVTERVRNPLALKGLNVGILFPLAPGEKL